MAGGPVTLDFVNYREKVSDYIPAGEYDAVVEFVDHDRAGQKAKNPGAMVVVLTLRIEGGQFDGATLIDRFTLTENAMFRIANFMKAIGLKIPKGKKVKLDTNKFVGKRVHVVTRDDDWNGEKRTQVSSYAPYGAETAPDDGTDLDDVDSFDAASPEPEPEPEPDTDDEGVKDDGNVLDSKPVDTAKSPWEESSGEADDEIDLEDL